MTAVWIETLLGIMVPANRTPGPRPQPAMETVAPGITSIGNDIYEVEGAECCGTALVGVHLDRPESDWCSIDEMDTYGHWGCEARTDDDYYVICDQDCSDCWFCQEHPHYTKYCYELPSRDALGALPFCTNDGKCHPEDPSKAECQRCLGCPVCCTPCTHIRAVRKYLEEAK